MENHPKYPGLPKFESQVIQGVEAVRILEEESFKVKWANLLEDSIAKSVFQIHGVNRFEEVILRKQVSRSQFMPFLATQKPCLIGMEACGGSHHWSRELEKLGL